MNWVISTQKKIYAKFSRKHIATVRETSPVNRKFFSFIFKIYTLILEILVPWMLYKPLQIVDRPPHTQGLLLGMQVASLIWKMHQLKFSNERRNTTLLSKNPKMNNAKYFALFMYYNKERSFFMCNNHCLLTITFIFGIFSQYYFLVLICYWYFLLLRSISWITILQHHEIGKKKNLPYCHF